MNTKIAKHASTALTKIADALVVANKLFAGEVKVPQELKK